MAKRCHAISIIISFSFGYGYFYERPRKDKAYGLADSTFVSFLGHNLGVNGSFILEKDLLKLVEGLFA